MKCLKGIRLIRTTGLLILAAILTSGCTSVPEQLRGEYPLLVPNDTTEANLETPVRWGGVVLETRPESDFTCFEILSKQLGTSMRPEISDLSGGRFIACKPGFYDPEVFEKGREVTLTGKIIYMDTRKVGEYDYHYPVVDIGFMSLWPKRRLVIHHTHYSPYYWHYPPYGIHYRYPYW